MTSSYSTTLSLENFGLQVLALSGDDEGVQEAIDSGANVNAIDASGRSALMSAIAGKHWSDISVAHDESFMTPSRLNVIDMILRRPEITLFTLNAPNPAFNDATPLGMAAWLNMPGAVRVLLESSLDSVVVDGTDMHGSTPLMYAARDGNLDIVRLLLKHGARPDVRALNHRTAIQYAISHPQVLYLCETMLRQNRVHEWKLKTSVLADSQDLLQRSVASIPMVQIHDAPPASVFTPSSLSQATNTILHYIRSDHQALCTTLFVELVSVSPPPLVNNRDANGWSPIHHCASMPEPSVQVLDALYCAGADVALFTEAEHYTALHCFASSDHTKTSSEALYQYAHHLIHDLRAPLSAQDRKGNTCIHIAAQRGHTIEALKVLLKCDPSHSVRDTCNAKGLTAWDVAKPEFRIAFEEHSEVCRPGSSLSTNTLRPALCSLESFLEQDVSRHLLSIPDSDFDVVGAASQLIDNLRISSPSIYHDADTRHLKHLESIVTEIDELQRAIINHFTTRAKQVSDVLRNLESDVQGTTTMLDSTAHLVNTKLQELGPHPGSGTRASEDSELTCVSQRMSTASSGLPKRKYSLSKPKTLDSESLDGNVSPVDAEKQSTTSRFVAWIKRKTSANAISLKVSTFTEASKKDVEIQTISSEESDIKILKSIIVNPALQMSSMTLRAVERDIESIQDCIVSTKGLLDSACRSISRADRLLKRALKARKTMIADLRTVGNDLFIRSNSLSAKSSSASIASVSTIASRESTGDGTFGDILAESDDEETRAIRRLLLRKIEAHHNGVLDEIEMAVRWLRAVKDVVQCVKRRTYV